jgi:hypothetical protein
VTDQDTPALPAGDYAIVEILGHRTLVGRVEEVERFGTKMLQIEPIYQGSLLPPVLIGGGSLYAFTTCSADVAAKRGPTEDYQLPQSLRATLPAPALPAPVDDLHDDDEDPVFAPAFLRGDD